MGSMRLRALVAAACLVAGMAVATHPVAAAPLNACVRSGSNVVFCDHLVAAAGTRGAIGLIGDSVMLGSAQSVSNPSLAAMLQGQGWGPIRATSTLGMTTLNTSSARIDASAFHWMGRWQADGFTPSVIAVNLGANQLGTCRPSTAATCKAAIDTLLNEIWTRYPNARVWWAKIVHYQVSPGGGARYSDGMLGWNAALDLAVTERTAQGRDLVAWDWPFALAVASPPLQMDLASVHPSSATQYVRRSAMMADHILNMMGRSSLIGLAAAVPAATSGALEYVPVTPQRVLDGPLAAGSTTVVNLSATVGKPVGSAAAVLSFTATGSPANGWITAHDCAQTRPLVSHLNYPAAGSRSSQVIVDLTADDTVCLYASHTISITVDVHGFFTTGDGLRLTPVGPNRLVVNKAPGRVPRSTISVPGATVVALNVAAAGPSQGGRLIISDCQPITGPRATVTFGPNEPVSGLIFAPTGPSGEVCVDVVAGADLVDVYIDHMGSLSPGGTLAYTTAGPQRLLDTRNATGGWINRHGRAQTINIPVAPAGAQAVSGSLVITYPVINGHLRAGPCGAPTPPTAAVNAAANLVLVNGMTTAIGANQQLCVWANSSTHTIFDVWGWWMP
jgi:hypothetical protein